MYISCLFIFKKKRYIHTKMVAKIVFHDVCYFQGIYISNFEDKRSGILWKVVFIKLKIITNYKDKTHMFMRAYVTSFLKIKYIPPFFFYFILLLSCAWYWWTKLTAKINAMSWSRLCVIVWCPSDQKPK